VAALDRHRTDCRAFAERLTWEACARTFVKHVAAATQGPRKLAA
jgi:hypothetical protein